MRGHIIKRYEGSYNIVLNLGRDPVTRKRKQQWISIKGTKKEAEKKLADLLHQLDTGSFVRSTKITLGEFVKRWLKDYAAANLAPRTAQGYEAIAETHLLPLLGNIPLVELKPETIQKYYSDKMAGGRHDKKGGLSARTVRHHHMLLHCALRYAVKWGVLNRNPADAVTAPKPQRCEIHAWSEENIQSFLKNAKETPYYVLFYIALSTGMRRSELLALRWCDADLLYGQVSVTRSMHYMRKGEMVFRQPKTEKSRRLIALPPSTCLLLQEYKNRIVDDKIIMGTPIKEEDLIFSQPDGGPLLPNSVSHAWAKLAKRTGLKGMRLHDARHIHASFLLKQGVHPKIVQERLGHSSISITLDTYSHVAPGLQKAAAERFDEILSPKQVKEGSGKTG
jgi:integrase